MTLECNAALEHAIDHERCTAEMRVLHTVMLAAIYRVMELEDAVRLYMHEVESRPEQTVRFLRNQLDVTCRMILEGQNEGVR